MKKTKVQGMLMIISASILIILTIFYAVIFSIFGLKSGGSILMIIPLLILAIILIVAFSFLFYTGIKYIKK
ncbi:MAG TPA: hypothetical protein P5232_00090 [Candidatus Moranbacteria bacterium]|nr:hypothetical protein [Candidatus Moranbacteria bacterium]